MNNLTQQHIDKILWYLESVKTRPSMYIAKGVPSVFSFVDGFVLACNAFGIELYDQYPDIYPKVLEEKNWEYLSIPLWDQMRKAGLNEDEITQELLELYIEAWRRVGSKLSKEK